jgi:hypothetical protein
MTPVADHTERIIELVRTLGLSRREQPFRLASGQLSHDYIDGKRAVARGDDLRLVAEAVADKLTTRWHTPSPFSADATGSPYASSRKVVDTISGSRAASWPGVLGCSSWMT